MKRLTHSWNMKSDRSGMTLMIVMGIIGILLIAAVSMTFITGNAAYTSRNLHDSEEALAIAEAGIADTVDKMRTSYWYWAQNTNTASYGGGSFTVITCIDTGSVAANVVLRSTGTFAGKSRRTTLELLGTVYDRYDLVVGDGGAIVAGGNVTLNSSALTINGTVHCNGNVINLQGNPDINGNITACGTIDIDPGAGYVVASNAAPIFVPTYLPFDAWKAMATNGGLYYTNSQTFTGVTLAPSNGVLYVEGNFSISGNSSMRGTVVASGSITIANRFDLTQYNTNWPALLAGIDVNEDNQNSMAGAIFAGNNITFMNRRLINGLVIALNNVEIKNRSDITGPADPPAWSPDDTNSTPPDVILGGWVE